MLLLLPSSCLPLCTFFSFTLRININFENQHLLSRLLLAFFFFPYSVLKNISTRYRVIVFKVTLVFDKFVRE